MIEPVVLLAIITVVIVLLFDYTNGFHDAANAIATVVSTKVLTPRQAIMLAAVTNLVGAFWGTAVAKTIYSGYIDMAGGHIAIEGMQLAIACGLMGGIVWNLITWWFGMPSSSTHALVGGLVGGLFVSAPDEGGRGHGGDALGLAVDWDAVGRLDDEMLVNAIAQVAPFDPGAKQALLDDERILQRGAGLRLQREQVLLRHGGLQQEERGPHVGVRGVDVRDGSRRGVVAPFTCRIVVGVCIYVDGGVTASQ